MLTFNYYFQRKRKNTLLILMFHQVNDKKTTFYPSMPIAAFKDLCYFIKKHYSVIKLSDIDAHFSKTNKPAVVFSFDDGHYDIVEFALPILSELGLPFNINIDTEVLETAKPQDFVRVYDILNNTEIETYMNRQFLSEPIIINRDNPMETENRFTHILSNLSTKNKRTLIVDLAEKAKMKDEDYSKMLTLDDIKYLSTQNVEFGSHSHSHSILTHLNRDQVHYELDHSKKILENAIKRPIKVLAYPNGIYNTEIEKMAEDVGYKILLRTEDKITHIESNKNPVKSYNRINQYHQSVQEALAHTYKILKRK